MTTRTRKSSGRIAFVGSGPGDAGLLTVRAQELIARAELVVIDPDVPAGVLELAGRDIEGEAEVRPAVGEPADVAKDLVNEAKAGRVVIRLVSGDPLTHSGLVAEAQAVAKTSAVFDVVPGVPAATAVPAYAGIALGGTHTEVDVRGEVDWAGLAKTPGPIVLLASSSHLAEAASALVEHGLAPQTPVAVTADGTGAGQRTLDSTLATLAQDAGEISGNLVVTVGQAVAARTALVEVNTIHWYRPSTRPLTDRSIWAGLRGGSTEIVGTSDGMAPCSRSRSDISPAWSLVRGTSTRQP